ncbi:MAG: N-acetylmuramoyl-L-alanine amidase [Clostridia bacterium]|nr:N-acetylmuramoyl-L-alanine amidase [Clostridia bacterium]
MKKILIKLTALLIVLTSLFAAGCDSPGHTDTSASSARGETTAQSTTKYPPATLPSQSTQQSTSQSTSPSSPDLGTISKEDITDEKMNELITQKYLSVHENSRPGYKLDELKNIVIHYVANPKTSALQNWKYFENKNNVSAHFIIDLDGSILQCMPLDEVAWAIGTQEGNYTTISIECCHPDSTGKFTDATYESLVKLVSWLCQKYDLTADQVKRHYDYPRTNSSGTVWHKSCPRYFVDHPEKWEQFKNDLLIQ